MIVPNLFGTVLKESQNPRIINFLIFSLFCCVDESISHQTGRYYEDNAESEPSPNVLIDSDSERLWDLGAENTGTSHLDV